LFCSRHARWNGPISRSALGTSVNPRARQLPRDAARTFLCTSAPQLSYAITPTCHSSCNQHTGRKQPCRRTHRKTRYSLEVFSAGSYRVATRRELRRRHALLVVTFVAQPEMQLRPTYAIGGSEKESSSEF